MWPKIFKTHLSRFWSSYVTAFRLDRDKNSGNSNESFCIEINLRHAKWLISYSWDPRRNRITSHLQSLNKSLDLYFSKFENIIALGDFNETLEEPALKTFCESFNFKNLIKEPTCFKNPNNPNCTDLILTSKIRCFQNSCCIETGLPDFLSILYKGELDPDPDFQKNWTPDHFLKKPTLY